MTLAPGQIFTISRVGMPGDSHTTSPLSSLGFGLYLENPEGALVDGIGVYPDEPWPTQSECTVGANLPNSLNFARGESWQRVANTGDTAADFVAAPHTIAAQNVTRSPGVSASGVQISELALAGPAARDDEFVERLNPTAVAVDLSGWQLYRCTATGRLRSNTLQLSIAPGTMLAPGARWVGAGQDVTEA